MIAVPVAAGTDARIVAEAMLSSGRIARIQDLRHAGDAAGEQRRNVRAKVVHDSKKFLLQPALYWSYALHFEHFPPNIGDRIPVGPV